MKVFRNLGVAAAMICILSIGGTTAALGAAIVAVDRHLVRYASGVVYDTESGLEWYAGPDRGMSWLEASRWVTALGIAGGGWRMPTRREVKTLHYIGDGINNMTHLLYSTGYWIWAGREPSSASRWIFSFSYGGEGWHGEAPPDGGRALAVRPRRGPHP